MIFQGKLHMAERDHQGIVQLCWLYPWDILVADVITLVVARMFVVS